jgi:hypothetical protein
MYHDKIGRVFESDFQMQLVSRSKNIGFWVLGKGILSAEESLLGAYKTVGNSF